jgi:hypothetical protein
MAAFTFIVCKDIKVSVLFQWITSKIKMDNITIVLQESTPPQAVRDICSWITEVPFNEWS